MTYKSGWDRLFKFYTYRQHYHNKGHEGRGERAIVGLMTVVHVATVQTQFGQPTIL